MAALLAVRFNVRKLPDCDYGLWYTYTMDKGITHKKLYDIFKARDARFDGRYFVGVTSTGIYCRTVCRARMPKEENCRFFRTAAEAEAAGFRPCMTCRPEQAPGLAPVDASSRIALSAARLIESECSSGNRLPVLPQGLGKLRQMFDLYCDPEVVASVLGQMNELKTGLFNPGIRIPGCFDPFEMAVRAVLGQQITVKAACTLSGRIASRFGTEIQTDQPGLTYVFPTPAQLLTVPVLKQELGSLGVIASRAAAIESLARVFEEDTIDFSSSAEPQKEMKKLLDIRGVGPWTAQYIAMRTMAWTDAFPHTDHGIKKAMDGYTEKERTEIAEQWRPWCSYATMSLWNSRE